MPHPVFTPSPTEIYINDEALARLAVENDTRFVTSDGSIISVDQERWLRAQNYERDTWMRVAEGWTDARNFEFAWYLDGYRALPEYLGDVIELGAGPFTNARLVLERHRALHVTLLDPLIRDYLTLPTCPYIYGHLHGVPVTIEDRTIEDFPARPFDTVIMINTLHHCRDVERVLSQVWDMVHTNGWLVWGEEPREIDPAVTYDVGHPLAPSVAVIEAFLARFTPLYRRGWYLIGQRKNG